MFNIMIIFTFFLFFKTILCRRSTVSCKVLTDLFMDSISSYMCYTCKFHNKVSQHELYPYKYNIPSVKREKRMKSGTALIWEWKICSQVTAVNRTKQRIMKVSTHCMYTQYTLIVNTLNDGVEIR